jgi:hypothetical protein
MAHRLPFKPYDVVAYNFQNPNVQAFVSVPAVAGRYAMLDYASWELFNTAAVAASGDIFVSDGAVILFQHRLFIPATVNSSAFFQLHPGTAIIAQAVSRPINVAFIAASGANTIQVVACGGYYV